MTTPVLIAATKHEWLIRPAMEADNDALARMALAAREGGDAYPPPDVAPTLSGVLDWVSSERYRARWVADLDGALGGHIGVTNPHPYITRFLARCSLAPALPVMEIGKFFVAPAARRTGIGRRLLGTACAHIAAVGAVPVLAVLPGSPAAIRLYEAARFTRAGSFVGVHGLNWVYVLAEEVVIGALTQE